MASKKCFYLLLGLALTAVAVTTPKLHAQTVTVVETTGSQSELLAKQPSVSFGAASGGTSTITITPSVAYQQMDGFGAAMTDSSAYNIHNYLTSSQQSSLMQNLFSTTSGIGLTFLRQPMGATDFSAQGNFSYDDKPSGQTDVNLANFSIAKDLTYTIPVLKEAFAVNPDIKVEMLPWSPPAWMKSSGTMNGGNFNDTYMPSLAQYFVKTIQAYQGEGIPVYAISPQNEPENSNSGYPTETFSASEEETFIANNLGPALSSAGLNTKIFGYEHNWGDTTYPETLLGDSAAAKYLAGTSWHCYSGNVSAQTTVEQAYPGYGAWFTECSGETTGNFSGDLGWGMENLIIGAPRNYAKAVLQWNVALNQNSGPTNGGCTDCYGFVTINTSVSPATVTPTTSYYLYGQANGVVPGGYRIESNSAAIGAGGIEDVAFQNPNGSIVLIVYNDGSSAATFDVHWAPTNTNFVYTLPALSAATFYWTPSTSSGPAAPTNLTATAASSSQINLGWTASTTSGVTYTVYRSTSSGFTPSASNQVASGLSGTTYSNTGLTPGTAYYFVVEAVTSSGASGPSNQASATTAAVVPTAPTGLAATAVSSGQINLTWTAPATGGTVTYSLYRGTTSGFTASSSNLVISGLSSTSYSNTGLAASTTYYYLVKAVNSAGTSPASNQASATTTAAASISTTGYYTIVNEASGSCVDDTGAGTSNGTVLQQWACSSGDVNQEWLFTAVGSGYYEITTYNSSTLAWNVVNVGTSPGTGMQLWTYGGGLNEQFEPVKLSSGYYEFIDHNSGLCLNDPNGTTSNGQHLQINTCNGASSESFTLNLVSAGGSSISTTNDYTIVNEASGNCVDDTGGGTANGTVLQQWACGSGNVNQEWLFTAAGGGYYEITTYSSSTLAWNVVNAGTSPSTGMQLWTYGGGLNEQFEPVLLASGYYEFVDHNSGLCLNDPNGSTSNGQQLQINTCNGSTSEAFKLNEL